MQRLNSLLPQIRQANEDLRTRETGEYNIEVDDAAEEENEDGKGGVIEMVYLMEVNIFI